MACAVSIAVVMLTTAGTGHAEPYAPPAAVPAMAPSTLDARYAAERHAIENALATARDVGDADRVRAFGAFLRPERRFLYFDPRGNGRAIEVIGDIASARRVVVLVPGADTTLTAFDTRGAKPWSTPSGGAHTIYTQALHTHPAATQTPRGQTPQRWGRVQAGRESVGVAVVAWLGYAAPRTFSRDVITDERAGEGAVRLRRFLWDVHRVNPSSRVGLLCHSYGSVLCGRAAKDGPEDAAWRQVTDIALYGSPGTTAWSAAQLGRGRARIWSGRGATDWMEDVPHVRFLGLGLGPDPVSRSFGARVFDAGNGGHSDYLAPGSASLRNLTAIALGHPAGVTSG
ncbi:hypothetical protein FXF65_38965 [Actinomadura syzygii]|uniref:DUF1023 domain-containing protein n=1 Tax=Actinomadura syzygii TaxID=1427538 RepID=A0A5D0TRF1_9ACTN|nr:hypothetical protein FXF65_38965 [Actinomadura syzygii]